MHIGSGVSLPFGGVYAGALVCSVGWIFAAFPPKFCIAVPTGHRGSIGQAVPRARLFSDFLIWILQLPGWMDIFVARMARFRRAACSIFLPGAQIPFVCFFSKPNDFR